MLAHFGHRLTPTLLPRYQLVESRSQTSCSRHHHLGHDVPSACAAALLRPHGEDHDQVVPLPKMTTGSEAPPSQLAALNGKEPTAELLVAPQQAHGRASGP